MRTRLLAAPIAAIPLGIVLVVFLAAAEPSPAIGNAAILVVALIGVAITVWSVLTDKAQSKR